MNESNTENKSPRICVVSFPMPSALVVNVFLYSLIEILEPICGKVYVVTSNIPKDRTFSEKIIIQDIETAMHFRDAIHPRWWSTVSQFFKIVIIQMKMCWFLIKLSKKIDIVIFYVGGANLFLPVVMAKILGKKFVVSAIGLGSLSHKGTKKGFFSNILSSILSIIEKAIFYLSDQIIVESPSAIDFLGLGKYRQKIIETGARYIDTNLFKMEKELREKENLVGYVGRLEEGKGVMNFVEAIPLISKRFSSVKILIGGGGPLFEKIDKKLRNNDIPVEIVGWIPHDRVADYLNEIKLLVLPSYSEGLPTIVLEAMACGTPVLATPVGAVPDIIKDGETGFIMENNSPECIAQNIIRVLNYPNLEQIAQNARALVEREFTFEKAVERYEKIVNGEL